MKKIIQGSYMDSSRIIFAILLLPWPSTQAGSLTTTLCSPKLPQPMGRISALFDQDDTIYLFGGTNNTFEGVFKHALRYSISLDTLESAGQLPVDSFGGATVMNKFRNIFHLPGRNGNPIFQYFPDTQSFTTVGNLANSSYGGATVIPDQDTALVFGGYHTSRSTISLNLNTLEYESLPQIPETVSLAPGIWVEKQNAAYIFNQRGSSNVKYLRSSNQFQLLDNQVPTAITHVMAAVWDGRFGYLIGNTNHRRSLVQFDPDIENFTLIPVENFPEVSGTATVYVEKTNRIYMFGGKREGSSRAYVDDIWYISLDALEEPPTTTEDSSSITTMDPDIFNCVGRPDAVYPYPRECAKFVICKDNYGYAFDCPELLQFHPVNRQCTFPEWVDCDQQDASEN